MQGTHFLGHLEQQVFQLKLCYKFMLHIDSYECVCVSLLIVAACLVSSLT